MTAKPLPFVIAAIAATFLQHAAFAGVPMEPTGRTFEVNTRDLNLANPAHVVELDARIARAARAVCQPADARDLSAVADQPACRKAAIASASARRDYLVARDEASQLAARSDAVPATN